MEQGSDKADYLNDVLYDSAIIKDVKADTSNVDAEKEGDYVVEYTVTVDKAAYASYRNADKSDIGGESTTTVKVNRAVHVVTNKKAQELADQNIVVKTNDGNVKKSDGSEVKDTLTAPASVEKTDGKIINASTKQEVSKDEITASTNADTKEEDEETEDESSSDSADSDSAKSSSDASDDSDKTSKSTAKNTTNSNKTNSGSTTTKSNTTTTQKNTAGSGTKTSSSNTSSKTNTNASTSSNTSTNSSGTKPQHVHTWVAVTKTVHHDAVTHEEPVYEQQWVQDTAAYDEEVIVEPAAYQCNICGYKTTNIDDMADRCITEGGGYHVAAAVTKTVHHDATGHYENVQTGTKTVVDQAAYDETVTTGYKCSGCGATK